MTAKTDKRTQSQKFVDKAKELGCDEDEEAFDRKLKQVARSQADQPGKAKSGKKDG